MINAYVSNLKVSVVQIPSKQELRNRNLLSANILPLKLKILLEQRKTLAIGLSFSMSKSETFRFNLWSWRTAMIKSWILLGSLRGKRFAGRGAVLDDSSKHVRPSLNPDHSKTHIHSISLHGARILPVSIR